MDQAVLDKVVKIATRMALGGTPVARIIWTPPDTAGDPDPEGSFLIQECGPLGSGDTAPWE